MNDLGHGPITLAAKTDPYSLPTRDRLMCDVTAEYERIKAEMLLMRVTLGLNPAHDLLQCVRILHDEGREAFEKARGERCDYSHQWTPRR